MTNTPPRPYEQHSPQVPVPQVAPPLGEDGFYAAPTAPQMQPAPSMYPGQQPLSTQYGSAPNPPTYAQYASAKDNHLGIIALVLAFVIPLGGIIMGHVAKAAVRRGTADNGTMANWALGLSYTFVIANALFFVVGFAYGLMGY